MHCLNGCVYLSIRSRGSMNFTYVQTLLVFLSSLAGVCYRGVPVRLRRVAGVVGVVGVVVTVRGRGWCRISSSGSFTPSRSSPSIPGETNKVVLGRPFLLCLPGQ